MLRVEVKLVLDPPGRSFTVDAKPTEAHPFVRTHCEAP